MIKAGFDFELGFLQCAVIAGDAILRAVFDERAGDHGDAGVPQLDEMLHCRVGRAIIVQRNGVHIQSVARMSTDENSREVVGQVLRPSIDVGVDDHYPFNAATGYQLVNQRGEGRFIGRRGGNQEETMLAAFGFGAFDDARKRVIGKIGRETGQRVGAAVSQRAGDGIGLIAQFRDRRVDPRAGFRCHERITVDDARHRLMGHPGAFGNIANGGTGAFHGQLGLWAKVRNLSDVTGHVTGHIVRQIGDVCQEAIPSSGLAASQAWLAASSGVARSARILSIAV